VQRSIARPAASSAALSHGLSCACAGHAPDEHRSSENALRREGAASRQQAAFDGQNAAVKKENAATSRGVSSRTKAGADF
jgi:hypothetical protein